MTNLAKEWNALRIENLSIGENKSSEKLRREANHLEKQNEGFQRIIEDLHEKIQNMKEEKSEDRIKIRKLKENLRNIEEINSKEVTFLLKRIEEQAVEINHQKNKKACTQLKKEMAELKKKHKLLKFKAGIQILNFRISTNDS